MGNKQKISLVIIAVFLVLGIMIFGILKYERQKSSSFQSATINEAANPVNNNSGSAADSSGRTSVTANDIGTTNNLIESGSQLDACLASDYDKTPRFGDGDNDVLYQIADIISSQNETGCNQLKGADNIRMCLSDYYRFLSLKEKNNSYDSKMAALGISTVLGDAYLQKNISVCDKLNGDEFREKTCQAVASLDQSYCNFNANATFNLTDCNSINNGSSNPSSGCVLTADVANKTCLSTYNLAQAFQKNDISFCDKVDDNIMGVGTQLICKALLSQNPKDVINGLYHANVCYDKFAIQTASDKKDPSICEKIPQKDGENKGSYDECITKSK